tara:strand:+ start:499 stop:1782 length:1284 start_codon:yes stop_codon:yes gene_type:complete
MKKFITILLFGLFFGENSLAESYHFKGCKLSDVVAGDYVVDMDKKTINVTLSAADGTVQKFSDKIKRIEKTQIISEKIPSGKGDNIYFEYYLNSKTGKVSKLQYKRTGDSDLAVFTIQSIRKSECLEVKGDWDKDKIEKAKKDKEQEQILKAQEKIKKEQSAIIKCQGSDPANWTNCKGIYQSETGHKYDGLFKNGKIVKGTALFPGGAKYVGEFKNFKPHGFGNFAWTNGDKYFGEWIDGKSHGNGTKMWNDGREYSGTFKSDKLHGTGTFYYPDGKKYVGEFINGKRHGIGRFTYADGTAFVGRFVAGEQKGLGECIGLDGSSIPCQSKVETQAKDFSGKDTRDISIVARKWVRISQYETNSKKGKKIMDKLKSDFEAKAQELCAAKGGYNVLERKIEVLDVDETPAYGLEEKLQIGINGVVECK